MSTDPRAGWLALSVTVLARTVLVTVLGLVLWSLAPAALGWESTVVSSGSMTPALRTGDVAVVRPVDGAAVRPGQVLLVDDPDRPGGLRLHRLVAVEDGGLRLQGDANAAADTALVDPAAVHGVGVLRIPAVGLPVVWAGERDWPALVLTAAGALAVLAAAGTWRAADGPVLVVLRSRPTPSRRPRVLRVAALLVVTAGAAWLVPTPQAAAGWSAATGDTPAWRTSSAAVWACVDESAARARRFYDFQEAAGPTAENTGTLGAAGDGTYRGGVTLDRPGPDCGNGPARAITLDGATGYVSTAGAEVAPESFTVQVWFSTTTPGGRLFGFAKFQTGLGGQYDRHLYMTDAGRLVFGVYRGGNQTIATTGGSYADGAWHLATVTMGAAGTYLYVDGVQVAGSSAITAAEPVTGFWRFGWDTLANWPDRPANDWYRGSLAAGAIWDVPLTADQARAQYRPVR